MYGHLRQACFNTVGSVVYGGLPNRQSPEKWSL